MIKITGSGYSELLYGTWNDEEIQGNGGNDTIYAGDGADNVQGGAGNDVIYGDGGNDLIVGAGSNGEGAGNDWIDAGWGYDMFSFANASSSVTVNLDQNFAKGGADVGNDTIYGFDNVRGSDFADSITGNHWTVLNGHGENRLYGLDGNDVLNGLSGNDRLDGGRDDDVLNGGTDQDTLIGGPGHDVMTGGLGADIFSFAWSNDMGLRAGSRDVIVDFEHGVDRIDVSQIDADSILAGRQAFHFVGFSQPQHGGDVWLTTDGSNTIVNLSIARPTTVYAEGQIELSGHPTVTASDFIL